MEYERVEELLQLFQKKHILVIGDLMLDEFIWGKVSRISPEAPVPVVEVTGESAYPGGAANVARNLKEFCSEAYVMGVIGNDRYGEQLRLLMSDLGLDLRCLFDEEGYRTIVKTRIVARQQQMVRVDREVLTVLGEKLVVKALASLEKVLPLVDGVIFEDYAKGLLEQDFVSKATQLIVTAGKIVTADPNPKNPLEWYGLTAIKPNRSEAFRCAGVVENDADEDFTEASRLPEVSRRLLEKWGSRYLLITLGEHGMVLFERDEEPYHIPTRAQEVYDVSGAGDTAIALFTLALAAGATPREAAEISNHASSVVVGKLGTATLTPAELLASFQRHLPASLPEAKPLMVEKETPVSQAAPVEKILIEHAIQPVAVNAKSSFPIWSDREKPAVISVPLPIIRPGRKLRTFPEPPIVPKVVKKIPSYVKRADFETPQPAIFMDRDGTLMEEVEYCSKPENVHAFGTVPTSLQRLKAAGFLNIIITNQSGIGRGYFTEKDYFEVHAEFLNQIGMHAVDGTYFCPDHPDKATKRRKPGIGMIEEAHRDYNIDFARSWFVGDKASDIECGKNAGLRTILVSTGYGKDEDCQPDYRARDFASAVDWIVIE